MKKKSLLVCLLLVLSLLVSCSSSVGSISLKDAIDREYYASTKVGAYTSFKELNVYDGFTFESRLGGLICLNNVGQNNYVVYNFVTDKEILNEDEVAHIELFDCNGFEFVYVTTSNDEGKFTSAVYNGKGEKIITVADEVKSFDCRLDLFLINGTTYRVSDKGETSVLVEGNAFSGTKLPAFRYSTKQYYYILNSYNCEIIVYNKNLEAVSRWALGYEVDDSDMSVMENGNIIVQTVEELNSDAEEFTYIEDGAKYLLTTRIINPKNGSEKKVELDHLISVIYSAGWENYDNYNALSKKVKNLAYVVQIKDERICEAEYMLCAVDNNGGIQGKLFGNLKLMDQDSSYIQLSADRFVYGNYAGELILVDTSGKTIAKGSGLGLYDIDYNYNGILYDNKFYDFDLVEKFDITSKDGVNVSGMMRRGFIFENDEGEFYLYANDTTKKLTNQQVVKIGDGYFVTTDENGAYTIYNDLGAILGRTDSLITERASEDEVIFFSCYDALSGGYTFYRMTA